MAIQVGGTTVINDTTRSYVGFRESVTTVGTVSTSTYNIDLSLGNIFDVTLGNNVTFTFTNPPPSGTSGYATIILRQDTTGSRTATFTNARYTDAQTPVLTSTGNSVDVLSFFTINGGTIWFGSFVLANVS